MGDGSPKGGEVPCACACVRGPVRPRGAGSMSGRWLFFGVTVLSFLCSGACNLRSGSHTPLGAVTGGY